MNKISAIIPIYNTSEQFLKQCIESLVCQSYENWEAILVDDGSDGHTAELCDRLAEQDKRIIVLHQKNQGPSIARNTALQHVKGDFITFVDSDDKLMPESWKICITKMEQSGADCLVFGWIDNYKNQPRSICVTKDKEKIFSASEAMEMIASDNEVCGGGYPWNKMWRTRSILEAHNGKIPLFDTTLFAYEDKEWILRALNGLNKVILIPEILYDYRYVESSLTNADSQWETRQYNAYYAYDRIMELLKQENYRAYCGALNFYFYFGFTDLYQQIRHPSNFGGIKRIQKTKKHMYQLCNKIKFSELDSYKKKVAWILMKMWGKF